MSAPQEPQKQQEEEEQVVGVLLGNAYVKLNALEMFIQWKEPLGGEYPSIDKTVEGGLCTLVLKPKNKEYRTTDLNLALYDLSLARKGFMESCVYSPRLEISKGFDVGRSFYQIVLAIPVPISQVEEFINSEKCRNFLLSQTPIMSHYWGDLHI